MPINAINIIPEFRGADHARYVDTGVDLTGLVYRNYFPLDFIPSIDWKNIEGGRNPFVMAELVAWGSRAPRKGREFVEAIQGELPKIEVARDKTEKDLYNLQQMRNAVQNNRGNDQVVRKFIDEIYNDVTFTINAVNAKLEGIAKSLASTGTFTTSLTNNAGGVQAVTFNFGVTNHGVAKTWSTATLSTDHPLADIEQVVNLAATNGYRYRKMITNRTTIERLLKNPNVQAFALGVVYASGAVMPIATLAGLNAALADRGWPIFEIWESFVQQEDKAGTRTTPTLWTDGNIMFSVDDTLGGTQYTTTEEFNLNFGETMSKVISDGMILSTVYGHQDPIMVSSKAVAFALPVLNNANRNYILKTQTQESW